MRYALLIPLLTLACTGNSDGLPFLPGVDAGMGEAPPDATAGDTTALDVSTDAEAEGDRTQSHPDAAPDTRDAKHEASPDAQAEAPVCGPQGEACSPSAVCMFDAMCGAWVSSEGCAMDEKVTCWCCKGRWTCHANC